MITYVIHVLHHAFSSLTRYSGACSITRHNESLSFLQLHEIPPCNSSVVSETSSLCWRLSYSRSFTRINYTAVIITCASLSLCLLFYASAGCMWSKYPWIGWLGQRINASVILLETTLFLFQWVVPFLTFISKTRVSISPLLYGWCCPTFDLGGRKWYSGQR